MLPSFSLGPKRYYTTQEIIGPSLMTSTYQRRLEMPTNVFVNVTSEAQYVVMFLHLSYAKLEAANTIVWHSTP